MLMRIEEVENHFVEKISSRELNPGDRLPTVKDIRTLLGVGYVTAAHALQGLSRKGYNLRIASSLCKLRTIRGAFLPDNQSTLSPKWFHAYFQEADQRIQKRWSASKHQTQRRIPASHSTIHPEIMLFREY